MLERGGEHKQSYKSQMRARWECIELYILAAGFFAGREMSQGITKGHAPSHQHYVTATQRRRSSRRRGNNYRASASAPRSPPPLRASAENGVQHRSQKQTSPKTAISPFDTTAPARPAREEARTGGRPPRRPGQCQQASKRAATAWPKEIFSRGREAGAPGPAWRGPRPQVGSAGERLSRTQGAFRGPGPERKALSNRMLPGHAADKTIGVKEGAASNCLAEWTGPIQHTRGGPSPEGLHKQGAQARSRQGYQPCKWLALSHWRVYSSVATVGLRRSAAPGQKPRPKTGPPHGIPRAAWHWGPRRAGPNSARSSISARPHTKMGGALPAPRRRGQGHLRLLLSHRHSAPSSLWAPHGCLARQPHHRAARRKAKRRWLQRRRRAAAAAAAAAARGLEGGRQRVGRRRAHHGRAHRAQHALVEGSVGGAEAGVGGGVGQGAGGRQVAQALVHRHGVHGAAGAGAQGAEVRAGWHGVRTEVQAQARRGTKRPSWSRAGWESAARWLKPRRASHPQPVELLTQHTPSLPLSYPSPTHSHQSSRARSRRSTPRSPGQHRLRRAALPAQALGQDGCRGGARQSAAQLALIPALRCSKVAALAAAAAVAALLRARGRWEGW